MNLYLLISARKQIFAYFQYLICLNKILQSLNFCISYRGKVTKFITSDYTFRKKNFYPILSNPNFSSPLIMFFFNLIHVTMTLFLLTLVFLMISPFLWCQKIFWTGNDVFCDVFSLCCNAMIRHSCQQFGNAVDVKVGNHIAM